MTDALAKLSEAKRLLEEVLDTFKGKMLPQELDEAEGHLLASKQTITLAEIFIKQHQGSTGTGE